MRNLSLNKKLVVGFGVILLLVLVSVCMSFLSIRTISQQAAMGADTGEAQKWAWIILAGTAALSILFTFIVAGAIRKYIMVPVNEIVATFEQVERGDCTTHLSYESRDEFGQMADLVQRTFTKQDLLYGDMLAQLRRIAKGDLQIEIQREYYGDHKKIKKAIEDTVAGLTEIISTIAMTAEQVGMGASQVSSGAQALAAGSTQQASSIQQLTASVESISAKAQENTDDVKVASEYINKAAGGIVGGNSHMQQLTEAMDEIGSSSNQIANIIKLIEDIAFQTNILALNAAVEAARAGAAGKGFAVVADEVRNLAAKSADATKQTEALIRNSAESVAKGSRLTAETAKILEDVGVNAVQVTSRFEKIEKALYEQTMSIQQVKEGISQVSAVVQTNAATAEENSATSEELSAQAATLREEVGKFKVKSSAGRGRVTAFPLRQEIPQIGPITFDGTSVLGKY